MKMKTKIGLWIDHEKAVIVYVFENKTENMIIYSNINKHLGRINGEQSITPYESQKVIADDIQESIFKNKLLKYYEEVFLAIKNADSFWILGPGEAKGELKKVIEKNHTGKLKLELEIETADKMTDNEIIAKVSQYYNN